MNYELLWQLAGWTMIHYLWIGVMILVCVFLLRLPLRRASPTIRYALTLVCFGALAAAPLAIAGWLWAHAEPLTIAPLDLAPVEVASVKTAPANTQADVAEPEIIDLAVTPIVVDNFADVPAPDAPLAPADVTLASSPAPEPTPPLEQVFVHLDRTSQWLPWVWITGAPLTLLLLASGLVGAQRLRRSGTPIASGPVFDACQRLQKTLRVGRQVALAVSDRVLQPVLVGIVRPLVLLPPAALSGWSPEEIEMALVHELAHVRRLDNLVNLLQRLVESLLFFQPAVWLVSRWLRHDREECCDAIVVRHTGSPESYAELLINVAAVTAKRRTYTLASSPLARHPLAQRIRRILQMEDDPMLVSRSTLGLIGLVLAAVIGLVVWQPLTTSVAQDAVEKVAELEEKTAEDGETTENTEDTGPEDLEQITPRDVAEALLLESLAKSGSEFKAWRNEEGTLIVGSTDEVAEVEEEDIEERETREGTDGKVEKPLSDDSETLRVVISTETPQAVIDKLVAEFRERGSELTVSKMSNGIHAMLWVTITKDGRTQASVIGTEVVLRKDERNHFTIESPKEAELANADNSPFLPLEQQRIADLAYGMLNVEIAQLDEGKLKAVKEKSFSGGVMIDSVMATGGFGKETVHAAGLQPGDILVGLHVWPTADFDALAEVLRRADLMEFSPLKYYVLREDVSVEESRKYQERLRQRPLELEPEAKRAAGPASSEFGGEFGRGGPGRGGEGGEFGGRGMRGEFGGEFGGRGGMGRNELEDVEPPKTELQLITGRIPIPREAWAAEQERLQRAKQGVETNEGDAARSRRDEFVERQLEARRRAEEAERLAQQQIAEAQQSPEDSNLANLRYDGKTFDQWRTQWKTELKTEERTEAIKALAAFGRAGYGKEAAETILDVAGEYDFEVIRGDAEGMLKKTILDALSHYTKPPELPAKYWLSGLLDRYERDPQRYRHLARWLILNAQSEDPKTIDQLLDVANGKDTALRPAAMTSLLASDQMLENPKIEAAFRKHLTAEVPELRINALYFVTHGPTGKIRTAEQVERFIPELMRILFHPDLQVRQHARLALSQAPKEAAEAIVPQLLKVIDEPREAAAFTDDIDAEMTDEQQKQARLAAIRALGAILMRNDIESAKAELRGLFTSHDEEVRIAATVGLMGIPGYDAQLMILYRLWRAQHPDKDIEAVSEDNPGFVNDFRSEHEEEIAKAAKTIMPQIQAEKALIFPEGSQPPSEDFGGGGAF